MRAKRLRRAAIAVFTLCSLIAIASAVAASTPKSDFSISVVNANGTLTAGGTADYEVSITPGKDFASAVTVTVSGVPAGASYTVSPGGAGTATKRILTVASSSATATGSYNLTVTGTSGSLQHSATATLTVAEPGLSLAASPSVLTTTNNDSGTVSVAVQRAGVTAAVTFSVSGLPDKTSAAFAPVSTTGNASTLSLSVGGATRTGSYQLAVRATSGSSSASTTVTLHVTAPEKKEMSVKGTVEGLLSPGASSPVNVTIGNPNQQSMVVTAVTVVVTGTDRAACTKDNFATRQFSGTYPFVIPARSTRTLSQLGVPRAQWPRVAMLNLPVNQDACRNTTVTLVFSGTGHS